MDNKGFELDNQQMNGNVKIRSKTPTKLLEKDEFQEEKKIPYPKSVFFIISNELCERFSFYGMKTVLVLYFTSQLNFSDNLAVSYYHIFNMLCYFTPIFGAMIADGLLGKYRTILYISFLYAAGQIILSISSITGTIPYDIGALIGLIMIALGTGGIKPCVSAFGGDQFVKGQERELQMFFSLFYFAINAGSLVSTFLTPVFREDITCFGQNTCFPLAFGVPAILMLVAIIFFVLGRVIIGYRVNPPEGNTLGKVVTCICHAIRKKCCSGSKPHEHWLDYAEDKYDPSLIQDIKTTLGVLWLFIPLPVFWALFDQQGSRWTLQAVRMNGNFFGVWNMKPDQIQVVNPIFILALLPIFESAIYPLFKKFKIPTRPLQRMIVGMFCAAVAFVIAAFVQLSVNDSYPVLPAAKHTNLQIINMSPHNVIFSVSDKDKSLNATVPAYENFVFGSEAGHTFLKDEFVVSARFEDSTPVLEETLNSTNPFISVLLYQMENKDYKFLAMPDPPEKPREAVAFARFVNLLGENLNISLKVSKKHTVQEFNETSLPFSNIRKIDLGHNTVTAITASGNKFNGTFDSRVGAFDYLIYYLNSSQEINSMQFERIPPNSVSVFLQLPQYFIITIGEVLFSVTGLEFAYSEAPKSMKSVLTAGWLMTVAFGNVIVIIVAETSSITNQAYEFFLFAGLMVATTLIFMLMSYFYKYKSTTIPESVEGNEKPLEKGHSNEGYQNYPEEENYHNLPPYKEKSDKPDNIAEITSL